MKNAIITIAAGKSQISLIRKIRNKGFSVICVDRNPKAEGFKFCDECIIESTHNANAVIEKLERIKNGWNFCGIITKSSGIPVITTAKIAEYFELRYVSQDIAETVVDKGKLISKLNKIGVPAPKVKVVSKETELNIDFSPPFFVKPSICFKTHTGMSKVEGYDSLLCAVEAAMSVSENRCVSIEQFIKGIDVISIDWVFENKIIHVATIEEINSGEPFFYGLGWRIPVSCNCEEEIKRVQYDFISKMGINNSLVQTSMKFDGNKAYIIEVHLDLGGDGVPDVLIPYSLNYDIIENAINLAVGESPKAPKSLVIPTYLRFLLESEVKNKPIDFKYIREYFGGVEVNFNGLVAEMNDEHRIGAVVFQASTIDELDLKVSEFERWIRVG
ncbi:ATP-grasp domain-containing protein [Hippea jasoniae]|uniref:ATP-grasp domain-containing protein n=1 Tax=Hippea jasoniae TaxID=944479 RepID=UPI00054EF6D8|nr:hypothetical protein [Hippea jasoniae]